MHSINSTPHVDDQPANPQADRSKHVDAIVIGAGLGGLLAAAQLLQRNKSVIVVERLNHSGGRFTAKHFQGVQVSTGAVHMVPFGSSGVLARTLDFLRVPHHFFDADVFGSFHVHGKQYRARGLLSVYKFLGWRQFWWFLRIGYLMFLRPLPEEEQKIPFDQWLARHINVKRNPELVAFFASISRFALSLELSQVSAAEVIRTTKNMLRFNAPAIVQGGCGELTRQLEQYIQARGSELRLSCAVQQILQENGQVIGVRVQEKASGQESYIYAPLVVSDIGPRATQALINNRRVTQSEVLKQEHPYTASPANGDTENAWHEAVGLKVHILSDVSLIPHKGIMYCLDTKRIAGMVQPTNSDPSLAPEGKHLLISHQVIQSNNVEEERELALADLRMLFGDNFDTHCRILTMGTYRGEWPVNRIAQGEDVQPYAELEGLYLVGDAVKPSGYLMVEGVAQSVNCFMDMLDKSEQPGNIRHVISPPSRLNALRWLFSVPTNGSRKGQFLAATKVKKQG
jgi:phytoene dehydrogenase-like protein